MEDENVITGDIADVADDVVITQTEQGENQSQETSEEQAEESIMMSVLNELGLTEEYANAYTFEDGIDIDTPTGIKEVVKNTLIVGGQMFFDEQIKSNPELYSLYLHFQNGGTLNSFRNNENALPSLEEVEKNVDLQIQEYKNFLKEVGHEKDEIDILVANAIKAETIKEKALLHLNRKLESKGKNDEQVQKEITQKEELQSNVVSNALDVISSLIKENEFSAGIKLNTDAKKQDFYSSLQENLIYEDGMIYYNVPLTNENLKNVMEQHYLLKNKAAKDAFYGIKAANKQEVSLRTKNQAKSMTTNNTVDKNEGKISASHFINQM